MSAKFCNCEGTLYMPSFMEALGVGEASMVVTVRFFLVCNASDKIRGHAVYGTHPSS